MSNAQAERQRVLQLMLIEDDPIFRLGLVACLEPFAELQVVLEADSSASALQQLQAMVNPERSTADPVGLMSGRSLDLIILNLELGQSTTGQSLGFALCQQLRTQYPAVPVLLLGSTLELTRLAAAFQSGAGGYCLKGTGVTELVTAMRQVAAGQPYWTEGMQAIVQSLTVGPSTALTAPTVTSLPTTAASPDPNPRWLDVWRQNVRRSGIRQIEAAIADLNAQLRYPDLALLDQWLLAGRRRELNAARWLINRLLTTANASSVADNDRSSADRNSVTDSSVPPPSLPAPDDVTPAPLSRTSPDQAIQSLQEVLFQAVNARLQASLQNHTQTPLEIDILKESKRRELLYTVLRQLRTTLDEIRFSRVSLDQLDAKQPAILQDLWAATVTDFLGKYYTLQVGDRPVDVVAVLLRDADIVQRDILAKIPLVAELLSHLLFQTPVTVDGTAYAAGSVNAMARVEILLENLLIQVANATTQPLLNRFGDIVAIKQTFYDQRLLSSREIERFRNELSWRYRVEALVGEPVAIFESRFQLFRLSEGIRTTAVYAPRNDELATLSGIGLLVTLALEARDAIAPRIRAAFSFLGRGAVYVLTELIGRGLGLIGRGIIKGIGNALQDTKPNRNQERWR